MDRNFTPDYTPVRSFALTSLLAALAILAALDIGYLTHIVGYLVLMIALGVLAVIYTVCDKVVFVLNVTAFVIILFFVSGKSLTLALFGAILVFGALLLSLAVSKKAQKPRLCSWLA